MINVSIPHCWRGLSPGPGNFNLSGDHSSISGCRQDSHTQRSAICYDSKWSSTTCVDNKSLLYNRHLLSSLFSPSPSRLKELSHNFLKEKHAVDLKRTNDKTLSLKTLMRCDWSCVTKRWKRYSLGDIRVRRVTGGWSQRWQLPLNRVNTALGGDRDS